MPFTGIWESIGNWDAKNPSNFWLDINLYVFIITFFLGVAVYILLDILYPSIQLDDDSTRYLLSAFIQSLAAIIAIVVTLTLVAIQLTASVYSTRVTDVFKKHPAMLATIIAYVIGISFFAILLVSIANSEEIVGLKLLFVLYSYFIFIGLILTLIPYIVVTISHLNAEKAITRLIDQTDFKNIEAKTDPFQSAFDVIYGAILKDDYSTMSHGLKCVVEKFQGDFPDMANLKENYIAFRFFNDLKRCAFKLIDKEEEIFVSEVLIRMDDLIFEKKGIEEVILRKNLKNLTYSMTTIEDICKRATLKKMSFIISHCIDNIEMIEKYSKNFQKDQFDRKLIPQSYGNICQALLNNDCQSFIPGCIKKLTKIIDENISEDEDLALSAVGALKLIANTSLDLNNDVATEKAVKQLYVTYLKADQKGLISIKEFTEYEIFELKRKYPDKIPELRNSLVKNSIIQKRDSDEVLESLRRELSDFKHEMQTNTCVDWGL